MSRESRIVNELRQAGFTVLTRKQWGSRHRGLYQTRRVTRRFVGPADHAFAHITVTRDDGPLIGEFKADMREVERIGMERFGTGFPYNWGVDQDTGAIALGMPHDAAGAHTNNDKNIPGFPDNLNYWGHAIAWIGMPTDSISDKAIDAYAAIIAAEKKHEAMKQGARLYPHSKFAWKDCPCDQVRNRIGYIERTARAILTTTRPRPEEDDMPEPKDLWNHPIENPVDGQQRPAGEWEWRTFNSVRRIERLVARGPAADELAAKVAAKVGPSVSAKDIAAELIRQLDADE